MNRLSTPQGRENADQPEAGYSSHSRISSAVRKGCVALVGLALLGCDKKIDDQSTEINPTPSSSALAEPPATASANPKQPRKYLFGPLSGEASGKSPVDSDYGSSGLGGPLAKVSPSSSCPPDMVKVKDQFCIDRYESSLYDTAKGRRASIYYNPSWLHVTERYRYWSQPELSGAHQALFDLAIPAPPRWELEEDFHVQAASQANQKPNGYMNRDRSQEACENAGKRLCGKNEWVTACRGEEDRQFPYGDKYQSNVCNVRRIVHPGEILHGDASQYHTDPRLLMITEDGKPLLEKTGQRLACSSKWGEDRIYDMVGNLDEWVDSPWGEFLGGFFSRGTRQGCQASISAHPPSYYDYSLGTRCCLDLRQ